MQPSFAQGVTSPRSDQYEEILRWVSGRGTVATTQEAEKLAEFLDRYPPGLLSQVNSIVELRSGRVNGKSSQLLSAISETEKLLPSRLPLAELQARLAAESPRANSFSSLFGWANAFPSVDPFELARFGQDYPNELVPVLLSILDLKIRGGAPSSPKVILAEVLVDLKKRIPATLTVEELRTKLQAERQKAVGEVATYEWARSSLGLVPRSARQVAVFAGQYRSEQQSYLRGVLQNYIQAAGIDDDRFPQIFARVKQTIPPTDTLEQARPKLSEEITRSSTYLATLNWARDGLNLEEDVAETLWKKLSSYPLDQQSYLRSIVDQRAKVLGKQAAPKIVDELQREVDADLPPSKLSLALRQQLSRADTFASYYQWARQTLKLSPVLARVFAQSIERMPSGRAREFQSSVQSEVQSVGADRRSLAAKFGELSKYTAWAEAAGPGSPPVCMEKSYLNPDYRHPVSAELCASELGETFKWIDEKAKKCGHYTAKGALIGTVPENRCEDPIARDLKPCVKAFAKPYRFYHFTNISKIQITKPRGMSAQEAIEKHAELWSGHAWLPHGQGNTGLYSATDPVSTRSYGNGDANGTFYLYRVELPAGTTYLNIPSRGGSSACPLSAESLRILQGLGCPTDVAHLVESEYAPIPGEQCFPVLKKAFAALNLRGWSYNYGATDLKGCTARTQDAFVWTGLDDLPAGAIQRFTEALPVRGTPQWTEAIEIEKIYQEVGQNLWPALKSELDGGQSVDAIKGQMILGCENLNRRSSETRSGLELLPCADLARLGLLEVEKQLSTIRKVLPGASR